MRYRRFLTIGEAQIYCDAQTELMGLPPGGTTQIWATPIALQDGTFVVPAYRDDTAVPYDPAWILGAG